LVEPALQLLQQLDSDGPEYPGQLGGWLPAVVPVEVPPEVVPPVDGSAQVPVTKSQLVPGGQLLQPAELLLHDALLGTHSCTSA
jgi:hypothetical protein